MLLLLSRICCAVVVVVSIQLSAGEITLRDIELPTRLEVGYAVRILDMNGDKRLDIAIADSKRYLWLENPNWTEHVIFEDKAAKFDNVCFAPHDIDRDGRIDFAVGRDWQVNNTTGGGTIGWLRQPTTANTPWSYHAITEEPTTHRMNFVDLDGDRQPELIVAPLKGRGTTAPNFAEAGVRQLAFAIPTDPVQEKWPVTVLNDELHVTHNFVPTNWDDDTTPELLFVGFEGVHLLDRAEDGRWRRSQLGIGEQQTSPNRGASEIKVGNLAGGAKYIATIEPWHGDRVVVYTAPAKPAADGLWQRHVIDAELQWGHAVSCANLDDDADDELIIGVRDDLDPADARKRRGVRLFDPIDATTGKWQRQLVDPGSVAIEDLAAGDLNGDSRVDLVAVGRQTHNVKVYWNESK